MNSSSLFTTRYKRRFILFGAYILQCQAFSECFSSWDLSHYGIGFGPNGVCKLQALVLTLRRRTFKRLHKLTLEFLEFLKSPRFFSIFFE